MQRPCGGKQPGEHGVGVTGAEKRPLGEKGRLLGLQGPDCIFKLRKSLLKSSAFMLRATETTSKVLRKSAARVLCFRRHLGEPTPEAEH